MDLYGTLSEGRGNYYLHYKSGLRTSKPGSPLFIPSETLCRLFIEAVETNVDDLGFVTAPQIEWSSDPFEAAAEYLQDVTEGYLANLAFKGSALGIAGIKISKANGQFYPKFASDLLDCLALNPYSTEIFLDLLHNEIAASTKNRPFRKEWGELFLVPSGLLLISKAKVSVEKRSHPPVEVISDEDLKARYPPEAYQGDPGSHE